MQEGVPAQSPFVPIHLRMFFVCDGAGGGRRGGRIPSTDERGKGGKEAGAAGEARSLCQGVGACLSPLRCRPMHARHIQTPAHVPRVPHTLAFWCRNRTTAGEPTALNLWRSWGLVEMSTCRGPEGRGGEAPEGHWVRGVGARACKTSGGLASMQGPDSG